MERAQWTCSTGRLLLPENASDIGFKEAAYLKTGLGRGDLILSDSRTKNTIKKRNSLTFGRT